MASESPTKPIPKEASTPAQPTKPTLKHIFEGHEKTIWNFVFLHDSTHIVSSSLDGMMRKWDCDKGVLVGEPWKGEGGHIWALALSPDGKTIACGRENGSVQRWNADGLMVEGVWTGHGERVQSLLWSPGREHIASRSYNGKIIIRNTNSGEVKVGPIQTKHGWVHSLAYSPSGDKIASGGYTICIWDAKTGKLVIGPIQQQQRWSVRSLVWSSDSTKLYSASDTFTRVFDSVSGTLLHSFEHNNFVNSVALSPKDDVLAYGKYIAYGGNARNLALWIVDEQQETRPKSTLSPLTDGNATKGCGPGITDNDQYNINHNNFFPPSIPHPPSSACRLWVVFISSLLRLKFRPSRRRSPGDECIPEERPKRWFFTRRAHSNLPPQPATATPDWPMPGAMVRAGEEVNQIDQDVDCPVNDPLATRKQAKGKGKKQDEPPGDAHIPLSSEPAPSAELDRGHRDLWKRPIHDREKEPTSANMVPAMKRSEVVGVSGGRGFKVSFSSIFCTRLFLLETAITVTGPIRNCLGRHT
ncbi:WD40-repeat-containing domain protein [Suillus ampliporus]|nr:WD40-repeat-containing domain protein [Suillus ampliporus]